MKLFTPLSWRHITRESCDHGSLLERSSESPLFYILAVFILPLTINRFKFSWWNLMRSEVCFLFFKFFLMAVALGGLHTGTVRHFRNVEQHTFGTRCQFLEERWMRLTWKRFVRRGGASIQILANQRAGSPICSTFPELVRINSLEVLVS